MSKIFRLYEGGDDNIQHWQAIAGHLSNNLIDTIKDPAGANAQTQITSIPTPFARMDLTRTAFRYVTSTSQSNSTSIPQLDGTTIYHRLVSNSLDIAEMFFNIEGLQDKLEIIEWNSGIIMNGGKLDFDPKSELGRLLYSQNPKHKLLGETLKMFLIEDQTAFNFASLKHIYLLNYKTGPGILNIIGGTSPTTCFLSSANDLSYVDISFGSVKVFDKISSPLYMRDKAFVKFCYALQKSFPSFSEKFPDLNKYLDQTVFHLAPKLKEEIKELQETSYEKDYGNIKLHGAGSNVEILGFPLLAKKYSQTSSADENDFMIETSKPLDGLTPCVFPNTPINEERKFFGVKWQSAFYEKVPFFDPRQVDDRTIPNLDHIKYPYLTISDLLTPYLIELPYPLDSERFFDGNYKIREEKRDHGFALPLKKKFFDYFLLADLQGIVADGNKRFEMIPLGDGINVILRIPTTNNKYIEFSRIYHSNKQQDKIFPANEQTNDGVIAKNQFTLAVYPFLKVSQEINPHYRVLLVDRDVDQLTKHYQYQVAFYQESDPKNPLPIQSSRIRSSKQMVQGVSTAYYILEKNFDYIEVKNNNSEGILVPIFKQQPIPSKAFKFAIDFGTTNTHIEYKQGNEDPRPFDILENDIQIGTLHSNDVKTENSLSTKFGAIRLINIIKEEFAPYIIGNNSQNKFPQRSIVYDNGNFNPNEANFALADFNIPFWYMKDGVFHNYNTGSGEITPNLKWIDFSKDKRFERRTRGFLKQLMIMIRNKVLLNGGDLSLTEIVWFYPSSMPKFRRDFMEEAWKKYYERYFANASKLNKMSESFAPFYYYYYKENVRPNDRPAVNIDIGGGTTDVVIYKGEDPVLLSSFRYAANAVFGDGYASNSAANGFVLRYEDKIKEVLASAEGMNLILENIKKKNSQSVELIEFFFSLEENKLIKDKNIPLSFSEMLMKDTDMKLVFVLFYASIIYHIAKLLKTKDLEIPAYITFSGNGSKIIKLIGGNNLSTLQSYTKVIFEDIYGIPKSPEIELKFFRSPKEITCKGGLECTNYARFESLHEQINTILVGSKDNDTVPMVSLHYANMREEKLIASVQQEVSSFIDKFFFWNTKFNYFQNFGISPKKSEDYKESLVSKIKEDLKTGIQEKLKETMHNMDTNIEETLFFYPLIGTLNRLAYKIQSEHN